MDYLHGDKRRKRQMLVRWASGSIMLDTLFGKIYCLSKWTEHPDNLLELSLTKDIPFLLEHETSHEIGTVTKVFFTRCRLTKRHVGKAIVLLHNDPLSVDVYHRFIQTCEYPAVSIGYDPDWTKMSVRVGKDYLLITHKSFTLREISLVQRGKDPGAHIEHIWEEPLADGEVIPGMDSSIPLISSTVKTEENIQGTPEGTPYGYAEGAVYV